MRAGLGEQVPQHLAQIVGVEAHDQVVGLDALVDDRERLAVAAYELLAKFL